MFSRTPAVLVYALIATLVIVQLAIGKVMLFWLGVWGLSVLMAFAIGAFLGIRKGRDEYRPWR